MRQTKVAQRYAKAIFDLAVETSKLEDVKKDFELIQSVQNKELHLMLMSPVVKGEKKIAIFEAVFSKHIQPLTNSFFKLIFSKGRSVAINEIILAFIEKYRDQKGIKLVELTTAVEVSKEIQDNISSLLKENQLLKGKSIELKTNVDASIIGGLVVQVDDQLFDASIRHDLQVIKKQFIENMYISKI
ncbi:MAG: ATP synthase F1 subunit delta [Chitinophagia bacterium]|jgi:F-type H+-transporting ATPase subunit delta|nr:ATP synthase F1 subunit delta [Chitinophagia bacterium]